MASAAGALGFERLNALAGFLGFLASAALTSSPAASASEAEGVLRFLDAEEEEEDAEEEDELLGVRGLAAVLGLGAGLAVEPSLVLAFGPTLAPTFFPLGKYLVFCFFTTADIVAITRDRF